MKLNHRFREDPTPDDHLLFGRPAYGLNKAESLAILSVGFLMTLVSGLAVCGLTGVL